MSIEVQASDLFVFYGLLHRDALEITELLDPKVGAFLGPCYFWGAMYDLGKYPGVVDGDTLCQGIRYRLDDISMVRTLDEFENYRPDHPAGSEYIRKQVALHDASGRSTGEWAWIYWYNRVPVGRPRIAGGVWT